MVVNTAGQGPSSQQDVAPANPAAGPARLGCAATMFDLTKQKCRRLGREQVTRRSCLVCPIVSNYR